MPRNDTKRIFQQPYEARLSVEGNESARWRGFISYLEPGKRKSHAGKVDNCSYETMAKDAA